MRAVYALILGVTVLATSGCKTLMGDPTMCSVIKDGSFAVGSFGCMKIQDLPARDLCTKAALAGSLLAQQACLAKLAATGTPAPEIGDPRSPEDQAIYDDAQAIINEWRAIDKPSRSTPGAARTP